MTDTKTSAVINFAPKDGAPVFQLEEVELTATEPGEGEVLIRMVAAGICHTDIAVAMMVPVYPKVLGHEGAGYVEKVGPGVTTVQEGDPVLLSYTYCGTCHLCTTDHQVYCDNFNRDNAACSAHIWQTKDGENVGGKFFGQSSFAAKSIVSEKSVVNARGLVKGEDELKLFSPLGCGLMTGSGAVVNTAKAKPYDVIVVAGLGAVGIGAVMAAKIAGVKAVIAVDRVESRLKLAKELGATHIYNTDSLDKSKEGDFSEDLQKLVPGERISYAIDTTGVVSVISACFKSLGKRGKLIQIGLPTSPELKLDALDWLNGVKRMELNYLGESKAQEQVPRMIEWYRDGKFPFDKIVKFYPAKDVGQALFDMRTDVIKPVIVHS